MSIDKDVNRCSFEISEDFDAATLLYSLKIDSRDVFLSFILYQYLIKTN